MNLQKKDNFLIFYLLHKFIYNVKAVLFYLHPEKLSFYQFDLIGDKASSKLRYTNDK